MTNIAKVLEYLQTLGREVDFYTDHYNGETGTPSWVVMELQGKQRSTLPGKVGSRKVYPLEFQQEAMHSQISSF